MNSIADELGLNYSTIRTLVQQYRDSGGRFNRLLNYMAKKSFMKSREQHAISQDKHHKVEKRSKGIKRIVHKIGIGILVMFK